jgi:hypothetical protein
MQEQRERIKRYIYILLLSNIAIAGFQPFIQNTTIKIILAIYTMLTMLFTIIYVKEKKC